MRDDREHSVRAWLLHVEHTWNAGDLAGCLECLHADVQVTHRQRPSTRRHLARWLRSCAVLNADSQIRLVIEQIDLLSDSARVKLHIHCRCVRSMQIQETHLCAALTLVRDRTITWSIREVMM
jgi:hypothetical protein